MILPQGSSNQSSKGAPATTKRDVVRGCSNPFHDVGLSEPDTKLIKADLAAEIIRALRGRGLTGAQAARLTGAHEADISRIRNADLQRFTADRLVAILNRLGRGAAVHVTVKPESADNPASEIGAE